jgi:methyltransferase (TIGR00027 family)
VKTSAILIWSAAMTMPDQKNTLANNPLAAVVFYLIKLVLLPVFLLGYIIWIGAMFARRQASASATAQAPLFARWLAHHMGARLDEGARRLLPVAPGIPPLGWRLVGGPLLLAHRLSGYVPATFRYPFAGKITLQNQGGARQTFYDGLVQQYLPALTQFVILGAGYDTRALNLPPNTPVCAYEVDTPATSAGKRATVAAAGLDSVRVVFVAADFEHEDWLARLVAAGFDPRRPALFIWEGVTPYLVRAAVEDTLRKIASTAAGTIVAFDFFTSEVLESNALLMRSIRASLSAGGEPLKFGLDSTPTVRERVAELLAACGLQLIEQLTLGNEAAGQRAWGGFVVAGVK